jgi:hypothetical protein
MHHNRYDPWRRNDVSEREPIVLIFTNYVLQGDNLSLVER